MSRIHFLLTEENVWTLPGYTRHTQSKLLQRSHGFLVNGTPRTQDCRGAGLHHTSRPRVFEERREYVVLAGETLKTEFPDYEVLPAFHIFDLADKSEDIAWASMPRISEAAKVEAPALLDEMLNHAPIARHLHEARHMDNLAAWSVGVQRNTGAGRSAFQAPVQALQPGPEFVLSFCGLWRKVSPP